MYTDEDICVYVSGFFYIYHYQGLGNLFSHAIRFQEVDISVNNLMFCGHC